MGKQVNSEAPKEVAKGCKGGKGGMGGKGGY